MIAKYLAFQNNLSDFVGRIIRWLPLLMMLVLIYEIISRHLFGMPTEWAHESSTMLYGTFCILAGVYTLRHRAHVRSDVLYSHFSSRGKAFCDILWVTLTLTCMVIFFDLSLSFAVESWKQGELSTKSTWQPPLYPFKSIIPLAVALLILHLFSDLVRNILILFDIRLKKSSERPTEHND